MPINSNQIALVFSGGSGNGDQKSSLGGQPSAFPVTSGLLNNLFDDVVLEQTTSEVEQYRCLYIFNDGDDPVYNLQIWIESQTEGGSDIEIGATQQDEVQRLTLRGPLSSGSITLSYASKVFTTNFDANIDIWAKNIEVSMNGLLGEDELPILNGVSVNGIINDTNRFFDITYTGIDGKRDHPMIAIINNDLNPIPTASVSLLLQGSPVNTVAPTVDVETTPPGGVDFFVPTQDNPITIPKLTTNEGFPFWVKRTTSSNAIPLSRDNFVMNIRIESLKPVG